MTAKRRVAVVCFAGERLGYGTGHVTEALGIIDEWSRRRTVDLKLFLNGFAPSIERARAAGADVGIYTDQSDGANPFARVPDVLAAWRPDLVLVDVPALFQEQIKWLALRISPMAVLLDNDQNQVVPVAVLVNYNINQDPAFYASVTGTRAYVGPEYVPLNRARLDAARARRRTGFRPEDVTVTFGGTNPNRLCLRVLRMLFQLNPRLFVSAVVGGATPAATREEIAAWIRAHWPTCHLYIDLAQDDFYELLVGSAYVITAPGNSLYEVCYLGVPAAALAENEPTLRVAEAFAHRGWCRNLGLGPRLSDDDLRQVLAAALARSRPGYRPAVPFDGHGIERIITVLEGVLGSREGRSPVASAR